MKDLKQILSNTTNRLITLPDGVTLEDVSEYLQSKEYLSQF